MQPESKTWGVLEADTPFNNIFPDRVVPLLSIYPIIPKAEGCPPCYLVNGRELQPDAVNALITVLREKEPDTEGHPDEELRQYIYDGLPLKVDWFTGVATTDPSIVTGGGSFPAWSDETVDTGLWEENSLFSEVDLN